MLANALATSGYATFTPALAASRGALSRHRHLVCAYRIIVNKEITFTSFQFKTARVRGPGGREFMASFGRAAATLPLGACSGLN
jgi:hypothetical protein